MLGEDSEAIFSSCVYGTKTDIYFRLKVLADGSASMVEGLKSELENKSHSLELNRALETYFHTSFTVKYEPGNFEELRKHYQINLRIC